MKRKPAPIFGAIGSARRSVFCAGGSTDGAPLDEAGRCAGGLDPIWLAATAHDGQRTPSFWKTLLLYGMRHHVRRGDGWQDGTTPPGEDDRRERKPARDGDMASRSEPSATRRRPLSLGAHPRRRSRAHDSL